MRCPKCGRRMKRLYRTSFLCRRCDQRWRARYFEVVELTESGGIETYGDKNLAKCLKMTIKGIKESKVNSFEKVNLFSDIETMFETLRASYQFWLDLTPNGIITMKAFNELYKLAMDPSKKIRNLLLIANLDDYSVNTNLCWLDDTEDPRHLSPSQKYEILKAIARRLQIEY